MKITLGLDCRDRLEAIEDFAAAGADEFFTGYVPAEWSDHYGWEIGLNRRTFGPQEQFADRGDLGEAIAKAHSLGKPISVVFNAHAYNAGQEALLRRTLFDVEGLAPDAYLIADPALLLLLRKWGIRRPVHLSTGAACYNSETARYLCSLGNVRRVVLPRKLTLAQMQDMVAELADFPVEFEAMVMWIRCYFNDELCFTWHSREDGLFCHKFQDVHVATSPRFPRGWKQMLADIMQAPDAQLEPGSALDRLCKALSATVPEEEPTAAPAGARAAGADIDAYLASSIYIACALCAIPRLKAAGIDVLKIPDRGTGPDLKLMHLRAVRQVADHPGPTPEFCRGVVNSPEFCDTPGCCYYELQE